MGYIENNLIQNEQVVFSTMFHWWIWFRTIVRTVIICILYLGIVSIVFFVTSALIKGTPSRNASADDINRLILILGSHGFLFICLIGLASAFINLVGWATSELALTNRRVISKQGVIRRSVTELYLTQFEACQLSESFIGQLLG